MLAPALSKSIEAAVKAVMANATAVVPRIDDLLRQEEMPESIVVPAIALAIGPFFVESAGLANAPAHGSKGKGSKSHEALGVSALRSLRLSSLSLACTVRSWSRSRSNWLMKVFRSSLATRRSATG